MNMDFSQSVVVVYNDVQVQETRSDTCALFCLYFVHLTSSNLSMWDVIDTFHFTNMTVNEQTIARFTNDLVAGRLN
jgi:hypothetical protein